MLVAHSAIVNNASDNDGGGIYLGGGWGQHRIQSSTISGNTTSGAGGGVLVRFVPATTTYVHILTSTITNNTAAGTGGGIEFEPPPSEIGFSQDVSVFSSIVAGNFSLSVTFEWNINETWNRPTGVFNCINSLIYVAPGFPRPTDMGGCTFDVRNPMLGPLTPFGGEGNLPLHPLLAGSPAVDAALDDGGRDEQRNGWIADTDSLPQPAGWMMFEPLVDGDGDGMAVRDLGAYERNDRWQTELLAVRAQGPATHTVVTIPGGYDRGAGTTYAAASATDEFVTYALPIGEPGRYDLTIGARKAADAGKLQVAVADDPAGPWTDLGAEQDGYAATSAFVSLGPFPALFTSAGEKLLRLSVTGKNPASAGYRLYLDYVAAKRSAGGVSGRGGRGRRRSQLLRSSPVAASAAGAPTAPASSATAAALISRSPPVVDAISGVTAVAAGAAHTCALSSDGSVRCWGANASGQLGDGSTTARAIPPAASRAVGRESRRGGLAPHVRAHDGWRRSLLGRQRVWPARRRLDDRPSAAPDRRRAPRAEGDQRRATRTCALDDRRRGAPLGGNGPGRAGRRYDRTTSRRRPPRTSSPTSRRSAPANTHTWALRRTRAVSAAGDATPTASRHWPSTPLLSPPDADVFPASSRSSRPAASPARS